MKKNVLISAILAGALTFVGCGGGSSSASSSSDSSSSSSEVSNDGLIKIVNNSGVEESVDPVVGGVVVKEVATTDGTEVENVATVVPGELNTCADAVSGSDAVVCGPKEGVTYIFQSDFGKLGPIDNDPTTPDGGVLLYDALSEFGGAQNDVPVDGNAIENRIQEVYIPTNYIVLNDATKVADVNTQYNAMRDYLANVCNMKCIYNEDDSTMSNNPYFTDGVTEGSFVATYVMHFTRGTGEETLMAEFETDTTRLEYLTVSFQLDVTKTDSGLKFSSPAGSPVVFGGKKAGGDALVVNTTNFDVNSIMHPEVDDADDAIAINMAKYFDKLIASGDVVGVADYAKEILVENAQNPWPVKIYGTLHEMTGESTYDRSFVRNPGQLDPTLFGLDVAESPYAGAFANGEENSIKFNLVYPGGDYNAL